MDILKVVLNLGGIGLIIYGLWSWLKARRVAGVSLVKSGEAGNASQKAVAVEGKVACAEPLVSPVTKTPCLYFSLKVEENYMENGEDKSRTIDAKTCSATFTVDDGSGPVRIDASKGGDFAPLKSKKETKSSGLLAGLKGKDLEFGAFTLSAATVKMSSKYTVEEEVVPLTGRLYVLGKPGNGMIGPMGFRSMVLSDKSRDQLLASSGKAAKYCLTFGAASFALGVVLNIVMPTRYPEQDHLGSQPDQSETAETSTN